MGHCYAKCFKGEQLTKGEISSKGGNSSMIHIDWMIGSNKIDIDGVFKDGTKIPIFRQGNWARDF